MATVITTTVKDDLDGSATEDVQPRSFGLDGMAYVIDLSDHNYGKLQHALAPFIEKARHGVRSPASPHKPRTTSAREESKRIRSWAQEAGFPVQDRGRIPANVLSQYKTAHAA